MVELVFRSEEDKQQFIERDTIPDYLERYTWREEDCDECCRKRKLDRCVGHATDRFSPEHCDLKDAELVVRYELRWIQKIEVLFHSEEDRMRYIREGIIPKNLSNEGKQALMLREHYSHEWDEYIPSLKFDPDEEDDE